MKPSEIQIGKTYRNRGRGTTNRKVLQLKQDIYRQNGRGVDVLYRQIGGPWDGNEARLTLESFAQWAGSEVKEGQ